VSGLPAADVPVVKPVFTAHVGDNDVLVAEAARLWLTPTDLVLDATWGTGVFWRLVDPMPHVIRADLDPKRARDVRADYRRPPWAPESFNAYFLDMPYKFGTTRDMIDGHDRYGNNLRTERGAASVKALYGRAMAWAWLALKPKGRLFLKGCDQVESARTHPFLHYPALLPGAPVIDPRNDQSIPGARWELHDVFVLIQEDDPNLRHDPREVPQQHARKNHSYLAVLGKVGRMDQRLRLL
jgi:hypothetical protein